ncbi:MAG: M14 family metallopeptidase [Cytophagales bacterium]|nr:M14 family metallopeptidase [Cytophagales bacterium]
MIKHLTFSLLITFCLLSNAQSQVDLSYYLSSNTSYDQSIPTPRQVLGYEVGEWHVNHDQLFRYMEIIAGVSDRVSLEIYARTYENRPLMLLTITAPENHADIESIRQQHVGLSDPSSQNNPNIADMPVVVWLGYSVHGNESSGTNSSLLTVYHLAAATGPDIESMLKNTIILVDPMINPDGNMRFSSWVNSRKSKNVIADPNNHEQNEPWPRGRTNHYWFDLNRDWILLQHPETRGRIEQFHRWKPNILTDHHEMGTNATFFFQPGVPSRNHPLTPQNTFKLTNQIAGYHEKGLDKIGSLYYAKEGFDDFYYGKGSTYPDINGGVGILFEQASSRGHAQESVNGTLKFPFTIRNQFTATLSTLEASQQLRKELLTHQSEFFNNAKSQAAKNAVKGIVFGAVPDRSRLNAMAEILQRHQIRVHKLGQPVDFEGETFEPDNSYIVPLNQQQYLLIKALFETRTSFRDSLFYDVSAWTLPMAFNIPYAELTARTFDNNSVAEEVQDFSLTTTKFPADKPTYAYGLNWNEYFAPRVLFKLLKAGIRAKVVTEPFTHVNGKAYNYGTIIIPLHNQPLSPAQIHRIMDEIKAKGGVEEIFHFNSGASVNGNYLGSNKMKNVVQPKLALIVGEGIAGYDAGEVWHLLDERFDMELSLLPIHKVADTRLERYNTIVLVEGNYAGLGSRARDKIRRWAQNGGNIIAMRNASKWLSEQGLTKVKFKTSKKTDTLRQRAYVDLPRYKGAQVIGGAIFATRLDLTHPLAYGYNREIMPVFKKGTLFMEREKNPYVNPVMFTQNPLLSGYISNENLAKLKNTAAVNISAFGKGKIISFTDNLNFRAYWYGTNKMFLNALFFGDIIDL